MGGAGGLKFTDLIFGLHVSEFRNALYFLYVYRGSLGVTACELVRELGFSL